MSIDTSYIQSSVASVLAEGLRETINARPFDPVDYLAKWLLHYRDVQDNISDFNNDQLMLQEKKQEFIEKLQKEKEQMEEAERLREEEKRIALEKQKKAHKRSKSQDPNEEEEEFQSTDQEENPTQTEENSESIYSSSYS